jgi:hypothetical protein
MTRLISILAIVSELAAAEAVPAQAVSAETLVERAGKRVEEFWEQFSAVTCMETVTQTKLGNAGKVLLQRTSNFDYLVILQLAGDELTVDESRLLQGQAKKESERPLLSTAGFSTLVLIFHPLFQPSYEYTLGDTREVKGRHLQEIRFEHIRGRRSPSVLQLRGRDYPLEWQGSAWIDPQSGYVARISVGLKASLEDVGLKKLSSEVQYSPIEFHAEKETAWLPEVAVVEANTEHQHWRNVHTFSRYRKFSVTTDAKTEGPKQ